MSLMDSETCQPRTDCWWTPVLRAAADKLTSSERASVIAWIDQYIFDAALAHPARSQNVTRALRQVIPANPDWTGTALQSLYDVTGDFDLARFLYGNLVCDRAIARRETWWRFKEDVGGEHSSSTYTLQI